MLKDKSRKPPPHPHHPHPGKDTTSTDYPVVKITNNLSFDVDIYDEYGTYTLESTFRTSLCNTL